ncbi:hypothetical protein DFH11DRAFT_1518732 [Phellopilus nigrolimitatus]|nr:hypothetical protein DFH11DRAFT_1518732 [Phellopilus nigrolimitatus]
MMLSSRSAIQPIDPNDAPSFVSENDLFIYCQIAVVTVLVYDSIITMDKEVKYFWRSSRSLVSLIYFLNRYIGLFGAFVYLWCKSDELESWRILWFQDIMHSFFLQSQTCSNYSTDKKLAICLRSIFAMEAAFTLGILVYIILLQKMFVGGLAKGVNICSGNSFPVVWEALLWTSIVVFELVLMVLALYRAADYWRSSAGLQGYILVKVVVQDQAFYFILVIICSIARITGFSFTSTVSRIFSGTIRSVTLLCVLGSRMMFCLKEAVNDGTSFREGTMSNMVFASLPTSSVVSE